MNRILIASLLLAPVALPTSAVAQTANDRVLTIFGKDPCPRDTICVRAPESERYRIPKELRDSAVIPPANQSWAARAGQLDTVERATANPCTVQGPNNWSGCWLQQMRAARAERKAAAQENAPGLEP